MYFKDEQCSLLLQKKNFDRSYLLRTRSLFLWVVPNLEFRMMLD
jgi:hypothetical protein